MRLSGLVVFFAAVIGAFSVQAAPAPSAAPVVAAASKAMGIEALTSIKFWGSGANFGLGQSNIAAGPWPRTNVNDYARAIDFAGGLSRATAVTFAGTVQGGAAVQGAFNQNITATNTAWAQQLEIWTTPWGFLKGAAQNNATTAVRTINGRRFNVVTWNTPQKSPSGLAYKVVGYLGPTNLVEKVETWLENPIFGDMLVENIYSDWREGVGGVKFPAAMVQKRGGQPTFEAQILGASANPADIRQLLTPPPPATPAAAPPAAAAAAPAAAAPASEQLAPGVWRITGAYAALAVEFRDYVVLFEPGPQNEARAQAIITETKRLVPGKPIRFGVISHHHFDHTSGLSGVVGEGITLVTPQGNKAFLDAALSAPRTLAPDAISRSGKKPVVEGFAGDVRVFEDATRRMEIHVIKGLPHADGIVVGWLPNEKILVFADMFNLPTAAAPVPNPPIVGTQVFLANLERLRIEPEKIVSIHYPGRLITMQDIRASLGR